MSEVEGHAQHNIALQAGLQGRKDWCHDHNRQLGRFLQARVHQTGIPPAVDAVQALQPQNVGHHHVARGRPRKRASAALLHSPVPEEVPGSTQDMPQ